MPKLDKKMETVYSQSPEDMSACLGKLVDTGVNFLGGCCGTGPDHIAAFRTTIDSNR